MSAELNESAMGVLLSLAQATRPHPAGDYLSAPAYACAAAGLVNVVDGFISVTSAGLKIAASLSGKA